MKNSNAINFQKSKKKLDIRLIVSIIVFCIAIVTTAITFAWFTDKDSETAELTFGTIDIAVDNGTDSVAAKVVATRLDGTTTEVIMPGDTISANLRVKNVGTADCYYLVCFICQDKLLEGTFYQDYYFDSSSSLSLISTSANKKVSTLAVGAGQIVNVTFKIQENVTELPEGESQIRCAVYAIQKANLTEAEAWEELQKQKAHDFPSTGVVRIFNEDGTISEDNPSLTSPIKVVYTDAEKTQFYLDGSSLTESEIVNDAGEQLYFYSDIPYEATPSVAALNSNTLYADNTSKYDTDDDSYVAKLSQTIYNFDVTYDLNKKYIYDVPEYGINIHPVFLKSNEDTYVKGTSTYLILSRSRTSTTMAEFIDSKIKSLVIPNTIQIIQPGTFVRCRELKHIVFPTSNLNELGYQCFGYAAVETLVIPKNITTLNYNTTSQNYVGAFAGAESLKTLYCGAQNISNQAFTTCTSLETIIFLNATQTIGYASFFKCVNLKTISIPEGLISIDTAAFEMCTSLKTIDLPNSLQTIGEAAFHLCHSLKDVKVGINLKTISYRAFQSCTSLNTIDLPNSITSLGSLAFYQSGLSGAIGIPANATFEGGNSNGPFIECYGITGFYLNGESTKYIERDGIIYEKISGGLELELFPNGKSGTITIDSDVISLRRFEPESGINIERFVVASGNTSFSTDENGVLFNKNKTELRCFPLGSALTHYDVPNTVTNIYALNGKNLVSLTIPSSVTSMVGCAMQCNAIYPSNLKRINSNVDGVYDFSITKLTKIPYKNFEYHYNLKHLILPSTCTTIESGALHYTGCNEITTYATSKVAITTAGGYAPSGDLLEYTGYVNNNGTVSYTGVTQLNVMSEELKTAYTNDSEWGVYINSTGASGAKPKMTVNVIS